MDIPARIEKLQFALGCTQAEAAEVLGIGLSMFHYIRKGERNPSRKVLAKLEEAERGLGLRPRDPNEKESAPDPNLVEMIGPMVRMDYAALEGLREEIKAMRKETSERLAAVEAALEKLAGE